MALSGYGDLAWPIWKDVDAEGQRLSTALDGLVLRPKWHN